MSPNEAIVDIDRRFLEQQKDRITITADFIVDNAMRSPSPALFDGDLHVAGRAPAIGFRLVAELKNAAGQERAVALIHRAESTHAALRLTGVWRLWPEHAVYPENQQQPVAPLTTPNPDHIFEIHPLMEIAGLSVLDTFHPVEGYRPGNASRTFGIYQDAECTLQLLPTTVRLTTSNWLYNDVHFLMELRAEPQVVVPEGRFVTAAALDSDGKQLVDSLRMVLVRNSAPELAVRDLKPGARLHVWGLPRVSFAELSRRIAAAGAGSRATLRGSLPYEIIVLGVYKE